MAVKKWRGKWVVDFIVDGKRVRRVSPVQTKRGAKAYEVELRLELTSTTPEPSAAPAAEAPTLADFAGEWMRTAVRIQNKPSEQARKEVLLRIHLVPFFGKRRLDQISRRDVEAFKAHQVDKGLAVNTINRHLECFGRLMHCALEWGLVTEVPVVKTLPQPERETEWLRPEEAAKLLAVAKSMSPKWFTFFLVALRTGLRKAEIFALHWADVDLDERQLTVRYSVWKGQLSSPKSGKTRVVPMAADLVAALTEWRGRSTDDVVFPARGGGLAYSQTGANWALNQALKRAELRRVRFHDLRHTFASHLVFRGCSLKVVQRLMGHHSVTMTERYAHVGDDQLAAAVEALDGIGEGGDDEQG